MSARGAWCLGEPRTSPDPPRSVPHMATTSLTLVGDSTSAPGLRAHVTLWSEGRAPLFQAGDMPTAQPVSERGLAPRRAQGLLRRWVHTPLEAMAGQHQEQCSPYNPHPGLRRA